MVGKTRFVLMIKRWEKCEICGGKCYPIYGGGWDYDRICCADRDCGAETVFPTTTESNGQLMEEKKMDRPHPLETQFDFVRKNFLYCDLCGYALKPIYGGLRDNDRIICTKMACKRETIFPTSTVEVK
jgi:hypothetical protein